MTYKAAVQDLLTHHENAYHRTKCVWHMIQENEIREEAQE